MSAHCCAHGHHNNPDDREPEGFRRVLWAALCINATLFLIEIAAGLAAGSASLQADALDFLGDSGNYAISLFVIGKALRYRSWAAVVKGGTMGVLGLWVIAAAFWHALHGTLPGAETNGCRRLRRSPPTPRVSACYGLTAEATAICARCGCAHRMTCSAIWPSCWPLL